MAEITDEHRKQAAQMLENRRLESLSNALIRQLEDVGAKDSMEAVAQTLADLEECKKGLNMTPCPTCGRL